MFKLRLSLLTLAALVAPATAAAHEFWLEPQGFHFPSPVTIEARVLVGDGADVEGWPMRPQRIVSLRTFGPDGVTDQQAGARPGTGAALVALKQAGAHVLALETNHAFLELAAPEFNAYAEHEGLAPILADRVTPAAQTKPGREMYSRRAKALIRVGEGDDDIFLKPIGMSLEIVPEKCPYHLEQGDRLPVRAYFHGSPLAGATVTLIRLDHPTSAHVTAVTDANGRASFDLAREGRWLVGVVWSEVLEDRTRADYDTTFSSLAFGF